MLGPLPSNSDHVVLADAFEAHEASPTVTAATLGTPLAMGSL